MSTRTHSKLFHDCYTYSGYKDPKTLFSCYMCRSYLVSPKKKLSCMCGSIYCKKEIEPKKPTNFIITKYDKPIKMVEELSQAFEVISFEITNFLAPKERFAEMIQLEDLSYRMVNPRSCAFDSWETFYKSSFNKRFFDIFGQNKIYEILPVTRKSS